MNNMHAMSLVLFAAGWALVLYAANCMIAGDLKKIDAKQAVLYFTTVALIGLFGEIFLDSIYKFFVGQPLWYYNFLPIQGGYTSYYAIVLWGLYGFHLYMLHGSLSAKWSIKKTKHLALIFALEALVIESLLTISAKLFLGKYMYYYTPSDLWHVTSVQNFPFYLICGLVILKTLKRFRVDPFFFSAMNISLLFVLAFLAE
jgi:hypothetical protein